MPLSIDSIPPHTGLVGSAMLRLLAVVLLPVATVGLWWLFRGLIGMARWRPLRKRRLERCRACRYALPGSPSPPASEVQIVGTLAADAVCSECGENLAIQTTRQWPRWTRSVRRTVRGAVVVALVFAILATNRTCERRGGVYTTARRILPEWRTLYNDPEFPIVDPSIGGWERLWPSRALAWVAMHGPAPATVRMHMSGGPPVFLDPKQRPSTPIDWGGAADPGWIGIEAGGELVRRAEAGTLSPSVLPGLVDRLLNQLPGVPPWQMSATTVDGMSAANNLQLRKIVGAAIRRGQLNRVDFDRLAAAATHAGLSVMPVFQVGRETPLASIGTSRSANSRLLVVAPITWVDLSPMQPVATIVAATLNGAPLALGGVASLNELPTSGPESGGEVRVRLFVQWRLPAAVISQMRTASGEAATGDAMWNGHAVPGDGTDMVFPMMADCRWHDFVATLPVQPAEIRDLLMTPCDAAAR